tara:strand:- start:1703 stop:2317 length:615 start_codon:yes stop_codon:yes gene_type:complete
MITIEEKFSCCVVVDTQLLPNTFTISINLLPTNDTQKNYNVALERINIMFREVLEDSILIGPNSVSKFKNAMGLNGIIHTLPDEPYDHLMAIALHTKITAILEGVFSVEKVSVTSTQGQGVTHTFENDEDTDVLRELIDNPDLKEYVDYWYATNVNYIRLHANGIKLESQSWDKEDLTYEDKSSSAPKKFKPRLVSDNDKDDES